VTCYFKTIVAPPSELVTGQEGGQATRARLLDASRYRKIAKAYYEEGRDFGGHVIPVLAVYLALMGVARPRRPRLAGEGEPSGQVFDSSPWYSRVQAPVVVALMLAGFFGVYLTTPHGLDFHLMFSKDRLLIQLWPSALFALFQNVASPADLWQWHQEPPERSDRLMAGK
jgi:hypothetical protein